MTLSQVARRRKPKRNPLSETSGEFPRLESDALIKYLVTWRYALFPQVHFRLQQRRKCLSLVASAPTPEMLYLLTRKSVARVSSQSVQ